MNRHQARNLAQYHKFTRVELYNILKDALTDLPEEYWKKPSKVNKIFDNGYYFNRCKEWVDYTPGVNDNNICPEIITVRVLEVFGKYSKNQLPEKKKHDVEILGSEKPEL